MLSFKKKNKTKSDLITPNDINNILDSDAIIKEDIDSEIHMKITDKEPNTSIDGGRSSDEIIINFDELNNRFMFPTGDFNIRQLVKYISSIINFLPMQEMNNSTMVIEQYICKNNGQCVKLHNYDESSFMSNIDILIKLNNLLYKYEKEDLINDLSGLTDEEKDKVMTALKNFNLSLLNYTLQTIYNLSKKIKEINGTNYELNQLLIKYSVGIVYRITQYIDQKLNKHINEIGKIQQPEEPIRDDVKNKINKLLLDTPLIEESKKETEPNIEINPEEEIDEQIIITEEKDNEGVNHYDEKTGKIGTNNILELSDTETVA